ncbi:MAG: hypothetical protein GY932_14450, partial [Arcobacter sp.]|nr:hypothetical protein [Arcobacter sp.]
DVIYVKGWMDSDGDDKIGYNEEVLIEIAEPEEKITVIVELPHSSSIGVGAWGLAGHTGIAIGNRYFDYGPELSPSILKDIDEPTYGADFNGDGDFLDLDLDLRSRQTNINQNIISDIGEHLSDIPSNIKDPGQYSDNIRNDIDELDNILTGNEDINALFAPGRPWWAKIISNKKNVNINNIMLNDVLTFIKLEPKISGNTYTVKFYVSKTNSDKMIKWWKDKYNKLGIYSIRPYTGEQCTTTVISSLKAGGINNIDFNTLTPQVILEDLKTEIKSTSIQSKDKKAVVKLIKKER